MAFVEVREQSLRELSLLALRPIAGLRLLAHALEPAIHVLAVGDDQLEPKRLEISRRVGVLGEAVQHREQRIGLPKLARNLRAAGHIDDADCSRRHLLRADDLRQTLEPVVCDHRHAEVRLLRHLRVGGDLSTGVRQRVEERRLPGVGEADDSDPERHSYGPKPARVSRAKRLT